MLQEATKVINQAFKDSFIKKLSMYLYDCVSEEVRATSFKNLNQDNANKWLFLESSEKLLFNPEKPLKLEEDQSKVTELMVQADISKKDFQLLYGFIFLKGKSTSKKRSGEYLAPLLYAPCKVERKGMDLFCSLQDESLSLNTSALVSLMDFDEEDDTADHLFEGLIDYIPELPITDEKIKIFVNTLKAILPEIDISQIFEESEADRNLKKQEVLTGHPENLAVVDASALVLTKRPSVSAGLMHELSQISERPSGVFRETALAPIHDEFIGAVKNKKPEKKQEKQKPLIIAPLELSKSQKAVIDSIENNTLVTVFGPPGTGKSQTIVNIASHLIGSGKTVLVASRMDKAVDVISERLNSFGAKYLCLRAGKSDYQKQLSYKLQDLISNKVDLDTGFESCVLSEAEDLQEIIKNENELKAKSTSILENENAWFQILQEYKEIWELQKDEVLIKKALTKNEIKYCTDLLEKIEQIYEKTGFINYLHLKTLVFILEKKLGIEQQGVSAEIIQKLRINLNEKELKETLKSKENLITKIGNLHQIFENLVALRTKYKTTAIKILQNKRREALKSLIRDQYKRQRLIVHSKALVERKRNLQSKILLSEDFTPLLEAFPCWAVTTQAASESLPLEEGLFDVAIIDEASQCDIASCFPILFRAKKAIIVGDDKQLPHLSFLEKAKEQSFLGKYGIPERYQLMWRFRSNSLFDIANYYSTDSVLLDEHFRSCKDIINFSNNEFYGSRIKVMKKEIPDKNSTSCVELNILEEAKVDPDNTRNMAETEKIVEKIQDIIQKDAELNTPPVSIGVISPFRGQVELMKKAIAQVFSGETVKKHQLEVGTAHTFQGDEKDIILLSFTLAPNSHHQSIYFAQKPNLFNVAVTRARKKLICYISRPIESLPSGLLKNYLEYIRSISIKDGLTSVKKYHDPIKKEIGVLLEEAGIEVFPDFETGGYKVDFLVKNEEKSILLELDGFNRNEDQDFCHKIEKHEVLSRCGWNINHITAREWHYSKKACINKIKNLLT